MDDHELDQLLKAASIVPDPPASFQRDVWSRIEAAESADAPSGMRHLLERALAFFALPKVAFATCAAMVAIGAWMGMQSPRPQASGEIAYVRAVSPFESTHR